MTVRQRRDIERIATFVSERVMTGVANGDWLDVHDRVMDGCLDWYRAMEGWGSDWTGTGRGDW